MTNNALINRFRQARRDSSRSVMVAKQQYRRQTAPGRARRRLINIQPLPRLIPIRQIQRNPPPRPDFIRPRHRPLQILPRPRRRHRHSPNLLRHINPQTFPAYRKDNRLTSILEHYNHTHASRNPTRRIKPMTDNALINRFRQARRDPSLAVMMEKQQYRRQTPPGRARRRQINIQPLPRIIPIGQIQRRRPPRPDRIRPRHRPLQIFPRRQRRHSPNLLRHNNLQSSACLPQDISRKDTRAL